MNRFNCGLAPLLPGLSRRERALYRGRKIPSKQLGASRYRRRLFNPGQGGNVSLSTLKFRENYQRVLRTLTTAIIILLPAVLFGQGYFGTVSGILTDPSAAAIQGAKVTLARRGERIQVHDHLEPRGRVSVCFDPPGVVLGDSREAQGLKRRSAPISN